LYSGGGARDSGCVHLDWNLRAAVWLRWSFFEGAVVGWMC